MKMLHSTDEIVKALENRDFTALTDIEKSCRALLLKIAGNLGLSQSDAEECLNDTFLEVWNTVPPAKPKSILSYACMIMRRISVDKIRYNSAKKRAGSAYFEIADELEACIDVEKTVIDEICMQQILNSFLGTLSGENREIFIRRYFEFEDTADIARDLLMSVSTLEKRLSRMRQKLKRILAEWGYDR